MSVLHRSPRPERPKPSPKARRHRRRAYPEFVDTFGPALALTVLIHLALIKGAAVSSIFVSAPAPVDFNKLARPVRVAPKETPVPANLLPPQMRPTPPKFVEVNPLAPSQKPDHSRNTGAADQRAAQTEPDPLSHAEMPHTKGDIRDSTRIVQNIPRELLSPELRPAPGQPVGREVTPPGAKLTPAKEKPVKASDGPAARADLPQGKTAAEKGTAFTDKAGKEPPAGKTKDAGKPKEPSPEKREGAKDGEKLRPDKTPKEASKEKPDVSVESTQPGEPAPKPRPRATFAGTSGPLGISLANAGEKGTSALDSRFSRMGEYASRMLEIIQAAWWAGAERSRIDETGVVVVEFTLNKNGSVSGAKIVEKTTSDRAAWLCLDAVTGRAPFDAWPDDMIGMFGDKQEGRITFHYR